MLPVELPTCRRRRRRWRWRQEQILERRRVVVDRLADGSSNSTASSPLLPQVTSSSADVPHTMFSRSRRRAPDDVLEIDVGAPDDVLAIVQRAPHDVLEVHRRAPDDVLAVVAAAGRAPDDVLDGRPCPTRCSRRRRRCPRRCSRRRRRVPQTMFVALVGERCPRRCSRSRLAQSVPQTMFSPSSSAAVPQTMFERPGVAGRLDHAALEAVVAPDDLAAPHPTRAGTRSPACGVREVARELDGALARSGSRRPASAGRSAASCAVY